MQIHLLWLTASAGLAYILTPGPGVLALFGVGASHGRAAGAQFALGHLVGDCVWAALALVGLIGIHSIGPLFFQCLGWACGCYLIWLGFKVIFSRPQSGSVNSRKIYPMKYGLTFGMTNPKSYPVAMAMFTGLIGGNSASFEWRDLPILLMLAFCGFLLGWMILIFIASTQAVRAFYFRCESLILRASGAVFLIFGFLSIVHSINLSGR
jgi:threonine efflux protein